MYFKNKNEDIKKEIYVEYVGCNKFTIQSFNNRSFCFCKNKIYNISKEFYNDLSISYPDGWKIKSEEDYLENKKSKEIKQKQSIELNTSCIDLGNIDSADIISELKKEFKENNKKLKKDK